MSGSESDGGHSIRGGDVQNYSVTAKGLSLRIEPTKAVNSACVCIGIKVKCNPLVLAHLTNMSSGSLAGDDVDTSIVAYCAFTRAASELMGTPAAAVASKATSVKCGCTDDEFIISVVCDKTKSSASKCAATVIKNLKFSHLYSAYRAACQTLQIKASSEGFAFGANQCSKAALTNINVVITGKCSIKTKGDAEDMADRFASKLGSLEMKEGASKRDVTVEGPDSYTIIPVENNMNAMIVYSLVSANLSGCILSAPNIICHAGNETAIKKLEDKIDNYATKWMRGRYEPGEILAYLSAASCGVPTRSIKSRESYKISDVKSVLKKALH